MIFNIKHIIHQLAEMKTQRFHGSLEIKIEDGAITRCKKIESVNPNNINIEKNVDNLISLCDIST